MTRDYRENSKLIWIIAGGLIAIILLVIIYLWINNSTAPKVQPALKQNITTPPLAHPVEETAASISNAGTLVDEKILKDQVPKNASSAKEEIAKLEDIQQQLDEQQQMLNTQHADADQLIKLKEEQIKLLEQQLAATKT